MISVIMPYWERLAATKRTLESYRDTYNTKQLEVLIVDDGSRNQSAKPLEYIFPFVRVIELPNKAVPKNPCVPLNIGIKESRGDIIVLTNPEVSHPNSVFPEMVANLTQHNYVLAASYCPDTDKWHCHSEQVNVVQEGLPKGLGLHFCSMISRDLLNRVGHFDEEYREGAGYEDTDFALKLHKAGVPFLFLDHCVTLHHKSGGATTHWPHGAHKKNAAYFSRKWGVAL